MRLLHVFTVLAALALVASTFEMAAAQSKLKKGEERGYKAAGCTYSACIAGSTQQCSRAGGDMNKRLTCCSRDCPK